MNKSSPSRAGKKGHCGQRDQSVERCVFVVDGSSCVWSCWKSAHPVCRPHNDSWVPEEVGPSQESPGLRRAGLPGEQRSSETHMTAAERRGRDLFFSRQKPQASAPQYISVWRSESQFIACLQGLGREAFWGWGESKALLQAPSSVCADSVESLQAKSVWTPPFPSRKIRDAVRPGQPEKGAGALGPSAPRGGPSARGTTELQRPWSSV